jgi:hypothetical protein
VKNSDTTFGASLVALAVLLLANAVAGPAGLDLMAYPLPETLLNQLRGLELVTVLLVVPMLLFAARLARRGRPEASLVAVGPCGYTAYMFVQYVVGPSRTDYSGAVLLHLSVFALAATLTAWSWSRARDGHWPVPVPARRRAWAALLLALATFVVLRYVPLATGAASGAHVPSEFAAAPAFYWSVVLLDLGVVVPAALAAAAVAFRGGRVTLPATYAVVGWFALVPPSVAAMAVVMLAEGDPNASVPTSVLMLAVAAVTTTVAAHMFRELLRPPALVQAWRVPRQASALQNHTSGRSSAGPS